VDADAPIKDEKDLDKLASDNESGPEGFFPVGKNRFWHGGVHLRAVKPVVAVRDGTLVAYRIDKKLEGAEVGGGKSEVATGFALLRHETATPLGQKIEFWSLAMHLLPWQPYRDDPTLEPPVFLRAKRPEKVKTSSSGKGLRLAGDGGAASSPGIVPRSGRIVLTGEAPADGHWAKSAPGFAKVKWEKLDGWLKIDDRTSAPEPDCKRFLATAAVQVLSAADPARAEGEIAAGTLFDVGPAMPSGDAWKKSTRRRKVREVTSGAIHGFAVLDGVAIATERRVTVEVDDPGPGKRGVVVRAEANATSPVVGILAKGTTVRFKDPLNVRFSAGTTYHEIEDGGFVPVDPTTLEDDWGIVEPDAYGAVVQPKKPVKISRGDVLGWAGIYLRSATAGAGAPPIGPDNVVHFEIFSDTRDFLANPNNEQWFGDTTYRLAAGATLKKIEPLPGGKNPKIAVDLPKGALLRVSERFAGSKHVKGWRHQVQGWKRTSELGHFRSVGYTLTRAFDPFYTSRPGTCWCDESKLATVTLNTRQDDSLIVRDRYDVPETFKLVRHEKRRASGPVTTVGWAREHELGDFYKECHQPAKAVEIAVGAKPASWFAALDQDPARRIPIDAGTWVRRDGEEKVVQTFHKVKRDALEGWVAKERIASVDAAKKLVKLGAETRFLKAAPKSLDEALTAPAHAVLAKGAELADLGIDQDASEAWVQVAFRDSSGAEIAAWARAGELGAMLKNRYVLTAALAELFRDKPTIVETVPRSLTHIEKGQFKKVSIGAAAREALEWQGKDQVAKERWERVELDGTGKDGWQRHSTLDAPSNPAPDHFRLGANLDFVLPAAPAQVQIDAAAGDALKVVGEAASGGVTYQCVELQGKRGWWPKGELGEEKSGTRELKEPLPFVLKDAPKDPPERIRVHALKDDAVKRLGTSGAFTNIEIVVTSDTDRCHGFLPEADLQGPLPAGIRVFQQLFPIKVARTDTLTFDPQTTFVFDQDATTLSVPREFKRPPADALRRDQAGHLWAQVAPSGWVDLHLDTVSRAFAHAKLSAVSVYDWDTWQALEEPASKKAGEEFFSEDGFCDVESLLALLEKDPSGSPRAGAGSELEMRDALRDPVVRNRLRNTACLHPSEWDPGTDKKLRKWDRLKKPPWNLGNDAFQAEADLIQKLQFWGPAFAGVKPAPASAKVWHFHPLGFLKQLRGMKGVTVDQLQRIVAPARRADLERHIAHLNEAMERYEISTPLLQAHFLSQVAHESAFFSSTEEGSAHGRPARPDIGEAYEWRFDLHNIRAGDGKRFKGRGLLQLTGRLNYSVYGAYIGIDLTANPELLATDPRLACDAAAWFWRRGGEDLNGVARKADEATVRAVTKVINGGYNGIDQRLEFFFNAKRVLLD
jgi:predicted chitinase